MPTIVDSPKTGKLVFPKQATVEPSTTRLTVRQAKSLKGTVAASPSKSYTHRAIIVASMGDDTLIENPLFCKDTRNTMATWRKLGAQIDEEGKNIRIKGFKGHPCPTANEFNVGESGTLLRFVLPMLALGKGDFTVTGSGSLLVRPNREIVKTLANWGVDIRAEGEDKKVPITVKATGKLQGGDATIGGRTSSQVVSGLLMAAPLADNNTVLKIDGGLVSRPYVDITIDVLNWAGIEVQSQGATHSQFSVRAGQKFQPKSHYKVHGDYSSAAFIIAAAVISNSDVTITGLVNDAQGDQKIISILRDMGATIDIHEDRVHIRGPQELTGIDIDCGDIPDLGPILTVIGCFARGTTRIRNIAHLKFKESNRILFPALELIKLGADIKPVEETGEIIVKYSSPNLKGGHVSACNDHRVAMSLAVAGLRIKEPVVINGFEAVHKSYPLFVDHLKQIQADVTLEVV